MEEQKNGPLQPEHPDTTEEVTPRQKKRSILHWLLIASRVLLVLAVPANLGMLRSLCFNLISAPFLLLGKKYTYEDSPVVAVVAVSGWRNSYRHWVHIDKAVQLEDGSYQMYDRIRSHPFSMDNNEMLAPQSL